MELSSQRIKSGVLALIEQVLVAVLPFLIALKAHQLMQPDDFSELMRYQALSTILGLLATSTLANYLAISNDGKSGYTRIFLISIFILTIIAIFLGATAFLFGDYYSNIDSFVFYVLSPLCFVAITSAYVVLRAYLIQMDFLRWRIFFVALLASAGVFELISPIYSSKPYVLFDLVGIFSIVVGFACFFISGFWRLGSVSLHFTDIRHEFIQLIVYSGRSIPSSFFFWMGNIGLYAFLLPELSSLKFGNVRLAHNFSNTISVLFQSFDQLIFRKFKKDENTRLYLKLVAIYLFAAVLLCVPVYFAIDIFFIQPNGYDYSFKGLIAFYLLGAAVGCPLKVILARVLVIQGPSANLLLNFFYFVISLVSLSVFLQCESQLFVGLSFFISSVFFGILGFMYSMKKDLSVRRLVDYIFCLLLDVLISFWTIFYWQRKVQRDFTHDAFIIPGDDPGSLGDDAMMRVIYAKVVDDSPNVFYLGWNRRSSKKWGATIYINKLMLSLFQVLTTISSSRQFVICGADVLDGYYSLFWSYFRLRLARFAHSMGVRVLFTPASFKELEDSFIISEVQRLSECGVDIWVRDRYSLARIQKYSKALRAAPDIAFYYINLCSLQPAFSSDPRRLVVINLNPLCFGNSLSEKYWIEEIAKLIEGMTNFKFKILCHDNRNEKGDQRVNQLLYKSVSNGNDGRIEFVDAPGTYEEVHLELQGASLVVTGRMHLAIAALSNGIPVVCFPYQKKFEGMLSDFSLKYNPIISESLDIDNFLNMSDDDLLNFSSSIKLRVDGLHRKLEDYFSELRNE